MAYLAGVLAVLGILAASNRLRLTPSLTAPFAGLSFFKLEYLIAGMALMGFFPESFIPLFERMQGTLVMFCVSWLGLYYGCSLEIRVLRTYPLSTIFLGIIESATVCITVASIGTLYLFLRFGSWEFTSVAILTGVFCSFTLFRRYHVHGMSKTTATNHMFRQLAPIGNMFPVFALGIVFIVLFTDREVTIIEFTFNGTLAIILLHLLFGIANGILLNMLTAANEEPSYLPLIAVGCAALSGGIAYAFSLSPLLLGTLTGAFLMNATLKRLQLLEALTDATAYVERIFMFLIGAMILPLLTLMGNEVLMILLYAIALAAFRMVLTFGFGWFWSKKYMQLSKPSPDLWIGLTGQGFLATAAAVECSLQVSLLPSVFLLFIMVLILNQLIVGFYGWLANRPNDQKGLSRA